MRILQTSLRKQVGAALPVALVMLLISTMVGLTAIRSAINQEKMSANMYDRSLAYQAAEEALRAAETEILNAVTANAIGEDCLATGTSCPAIPVSTFTGSGPWENIDTHLLINKTRLAEGAAPQYYIERIGLVGGTDEMGVGSSANCDNYAGCDQTPPSAMLYRVTARSGNPLGSQGRAIVALQTTVKQNM